jgi:protein O-GlcNAc transferase
MTTTPEMSTLDKGLADIRQLLQQGRLTDAETQCRQLLARNPMASDAWFALGFIRLQYDDLSESSSAFERCVARDSANADAWTNLSAIALRRGNPAKAEEYALRAITVRDSNAVQFLNLGSALAAQKKWSEATTAYYKAVACDPQDAIAWSGLAISQSAMGESETARASFNRSIALAPSDPTVCSNFAQFLNGNGQPQNALELLQPLVSSSQNPAILIEAGNAHRLLGQFPQAESRYRQALAQTSGNEEATYLLALIALAQDRIAECEQLVFQILARNSDAAHVWELRGENLRAQGNSEAAIQAFQRALALEATPTRHSKLLLTQLCSENFDLIQLKIEHTAWNEAYVVPASAASTPRLSQFKTPLRIGFISPDFVCHPTAFVTLPLLEALNRYACRAYCYSDRIIEDSYTVTFKRLSEWRQIRSLSDEQVASQVREDQIDILFDLAGHAGKRLLVFARKPAPVEIAWFGYPGTTGLSAMDYLLADRFHVREGEDQWYSESILRMPHGYACYAAPSYAPQVAPLPALTNGLVTFGCFNNPAKYSETTFDLFAAVLRQTPASRMLMKYRGLDDGVVQRRIRDSFERRGVVAERITLEGSAPHAALLAAYGRVDIALDTQPYSGGMTTCEALWMGVPTITYPGKTFAGRHATSHMTNAGFPEFVAYDATGYVAMAVQWADRINELAKMRLQMREQVRRSSLSNAKRFARDFLEVISGALHQR